MRRVGYDHWARCRPLSVLQALAEECASATVESASVVPAITTLQNTRNRKCCIFVGAGMGMREWMKLSLRDTQEGAENPRLTLLVVPGDPEHLPFRIICVASIP